jgi:ferrochelatase
MAKKIAVVLLNLGAPDSLDSVKPFLFNLFNDRYIINLPTPLRYILAKFISHVREKKSKKIYEELGGGSPLLELTRLQAKALEDELNEQHDREYKVFISMNYWHPFTDEAAALVKAYRPELLVLLPLYPQFSTTTTLSSIVNWRKHTKNPDIEEKIVCCYPTAEKFIAAHAELILPIYNEAKSRGKTRILFSAHGLPQKTIDSGDPYAWQVKKTVEQIVKKLAIDNLDWTICYQSKVGPLKWLTPSTEEEIKRAGQDGMQVVMVPVAFVSEHSETLVELDIEYKLLADRNNVPGYFRVPALGTNQSFIKALTMLCCNNDVIKELCPHKRCLGRQIKTTKRCV